MTGETAAPLVLASEAAVLDILDGFRARTLPHPRWTHQAHLVVGLWHVLNLPADAALDALRRGIAAYNESVGTANTDGSGYHETITAFYAWAIRKFVGEARTGATGAATLRRCSSSPTRCSPAAMRRSASRSSITAATACSRSPTRRAWQEPDLKPLD